MINTNENTTDESINDAACTKQHASKKENYQASLKSLDTEETIDLCFYRPIGYMWARIAMVFGITPNAITIAGIIIGVGAAYCFYVSNVWVNIAGMLLLVLANSFDSADGQLARITHQYSRLGRILDGLCGDIWFFSIYFAICLRTCTTVPFFMQHIWLIWAIGLFCGIFHGKQAAMADYYRQFHLYFLKGKEGSELESSSSLEKKYEELTWHDFINKTALWFYIRYTRKQERMTPAMQQLRAALKAKYPDGDIPQAFREQFRRGSLPLMKYTNILTFNWRCITLFVTLLIGYPWLYFPIEFIAGTAILTYLRRRHEALCHRMLAEV